ncbi:hypothetical protein SELMODRAFT_443261 [Selaginella moellendorffii]|uniref:Uncharacterized protein n=1 Tax=Selaginella moellendorffii TaxID=88036 RepID=D8RZY1_SELML|nr:hypothetical protein SELMODRAFT_443261 [Selaginella moellendorffii]
MFRLAGILGGRRVDFLERMRPMRLNNLGTWLKDDFQAVQKKELEAVYTPFVPEAFELLISYSYTNLTSVEKIALLIIRHRRPSPDSKKILAFQPQRLSKARAMGEMLTATHAGIEQQSIAKATSTSGRIRMCKDFLQQCFHLEDRLRAKAKYIASKWYNLTLVLHSELTSKVVPRLLYVLVQELAMEITPDRIVDETLHLLGSLVLEHHIVVPPPLHGRQAATTTAATSVPNCSYELESSASCPRWLTWKLSWFDTELKIGEEPPQLVKRALKQRCGVVLEDDGIGRRWSCTGTMKTTVVMHEIQLLKSSSNPNELEGKVEGEGEHIAPLKMTSSNSSKLKNPNLQHYAFQYPFIN